MDYAWSHAVVSDENHNIIVKSCDFFSNDTWSNKDCKDAVDEIIRQYKEIDMYSVYTETCTSNSSSLADRSTVVTSRSSSKMVSEFSRVSVVYEMNFVALSFHMPYNLHFKFIIFTPVLYM